MNQGKYVFSQLTDFLPKRVFDCLADKYTGNKYARFFTCWNQLVKIGIRKSILFHFTKIGGKAKHDIAAAIDRIILEKVDQAIYTYLPNIIWSVWKSQSSIIVEQSSLSGLSPDRSYITEMALFCPGSVPGSSEPALVSAHNQSLIAFIITGHIMP